MEVLSPVPLPSPPIPASLDDYLTVRTAAREGSVCDATIRRAIADKRLRAVRIGVRYRIKRLWLHDWLDRQADVTVRSAAWREAQRLRCLHAVHERWRRYREAHATPQP